MCSLFILPDPLAKMRSLLCFDILPSDKIEAYCRMDASQNEIIPDENRPTLAEESQDDTIQMKKPREKKPRTKAQMAAFEKARQKRLENLKLKREAKEAEKEHKMIKRLERQKKAKAKAKQLKVAKKKIMKYKAKKHKYVSASSDSDEPETSSSDEEEVEKERKKKPATPPSRSPTATQRFYSMFSRY